MFAKLTLLLLLFFFVFQSSQSQDITFTGTCEQQLEHVGVLDFTDSHAYSGWGSLFADAHGNYLIADTHGAKLVQYSSSGELVSQFGRSGRGPGDFEIPNSILRASDDYIYVTDMFGRITVLNPEFNDVDTIVETDLLRISSLVSLNNTQILFYGVRPDFIENGEMIHVFDKKTNEITQSFFSKPELSNSYPNVINQSERMANIAVSEDQIAITQRLEPIIYLYDNSFIRQDSLNIPVKEFSSIHDLEPSDFRDVSVFTKFTIVTSLDYLSDSELLMQTTRRLSMDPSRFEYEDSYKRRTYVVDLDKNELCEINNRNIIDYVDKNTGHIYNSSVSERYVYQIHKK